MINRTGCARRLTPHGRAGGEGRARAHSRGSGRGVPLARAAAAQDAGRFDDEIVPVGEVTADESVRRDTSLGKLAGLKPAMDPEDGDRQRPASTTPRASWCARGGVPQRRGSDARDDRVAGGSRRVRVAGTHACERGLRRSRRRQPTGDVKRVEVNGRSPRWRSTRSRCSVPIQTANVIGGRSLGQLIGVSGRISA